MSTVPLDNPTGDALVFSTPAGLVPSVAEADPVTGLPADRATQTTLAALKAVADTISAAAAAIQSAVEGLNGKTTAVNTGAIAGTVALDAGSLAALETINVGNFPGTQPVSGTVALDAPTLAALETINVGNFPGTQPVSAAALPLPAGAATEATLAALNGKTPAAGQATMANSSPVAIASDQAAIPVTGSFSATTDFTAALLQVLRAIADPITVDPASGRLRVVLDATGGAQTLGTVSTVTNQAQLGGVAANSAIYDAMDAAYAHCLRGRIT